MTRDDEGAAATGGVTGHQHRRARSFPGTGPLRRSRRGLIAGVAGGTADLVGANPTVVRLLWAASLPLSGGLTGAAYLILWILLPVEPE